MKKLLPLLILILAFSIQTFAVDFTVNTTNDLPDVTTGDGICLTTAGNCSLRAAVQEANILATNDRIMFNLPANSTVFGGFTITKKGTLEIIGTGASNLTIRSPGTKGAGIFYLPETTVTISGVTLTGGGATAGGAINVNAGSLTLDSVHVTGNVAFFERGGGGVYFFGGIHRIINSTFSGNLAYNGCGGFNNAGGTVTVVNSTISGNSASSSSGGGFCNNTIGTTILRNVTITNNIAGFGGGISNSGMLDFGNTIVAGNTASLGGGPEISNGVAIISAGGNLVGDSPGDSTNVRGRITNGIPITYQPTDIRDVNPILAALQNYGGTIPTHALLTGSPAIDTGLNALAFDPFNGIALVFDQRGAGFPRIIDGSGDGTAIVDIGAFEIQPTSNPQACTPSTTVSEGDLFPGGIASFGVMGGFGTVTVDHVNAGTGLQQLTLVGAPVNAMVTIPTFMPGTFIPVVVRFTAINPVLPIDFTLRAASAFHAANIRVRCSVTTNQPESWNEK